MTSDPGQGQAAMPAGPSSQSQTSRIRLTDLLKQMREIEIDHDGKIYRLRLTQANNLILTA